MSSLPRYAENSLGKDELTIKEISKIKTEMSARILGAEKTVEIILASLFSRGHVLLEGAPGMGKTALSKHLSEIFSGTVNRIQMTSDLLPSDIIGNLRIDPKELKLEFIKGPIFANFVLADELNRASPKTQSAFLESMAENQVTVDGKTYALPSPFFVIATQNPYDDHGTFSLTQSQLDRFSSCVSLSHPDLITERQVLDGFFANQGPNVKIKSWTLLDLIKIQRCVDEVHVEETLRNYILSLISATRNSSEILWGASVRATLQLAGFVRALACLRGRNFVLPEDVLDGATQVLSHKVSFKDIQPSNHQECHNLMREILQKIKSPV